MSNLNPSSGSARTPELQFFKKCKTLEKHARFKRTPNQRIPLQKSRVAEPSATSARFNPCASFQKSHHKSGCDTKNMMNVNRLKTVSEYKIPPREFKHNYRVTYLILMRLDRHQEHGTQKSFENKTMPKRTFKNQVDDTDTYPIWQRKRQLEDNLMAIMDMTEPPKSKYPQLQDRCLYCTEGKCEKCSTFEQLEERRERLQEISH